MNKKCILLILVLLFIFAGIVIFNHKRPQSIETMSAFISSDSVSVQADDAGIVKSLPVKQLQKVQKGQVIAEIETKVTSTRPVKKITTVKNNSQNSQKEYENAAIMYKDGILSQEEYDKYVKKISSKEKKAKVVEQPRNEVVVSSKITKIYAPIDGTVIINNLKEGDSIKKEAIVARVNSAHKEINAYFPTLNKDNLKSGNSVDIMVIKYPEKTFNGKIEEVMPADNKGIPVRVVFENDTTSLDFQNGDSVIVKIKQ